MPLPAPFARPKPTEIDQEIAAGIAEWPEWTVPLNLMAPSEHEEFDIKDPTVTITSGGYQKIGWK